jgi:hypothetical protein
MQAEQWDDDWEDELENGFAGEVRAYWVEMFSYYPRESAIVMQRDLEIGVFMTSLLMAHCAYLVYRHLDATARSDVALLVLCNIRLLLFLPRPLTWLRSYRGYVAARNQPTPQLVRDRLLDTVDAKPQWENRCLLYFYFYLASVPAVIWTASVHTPFAADLWLHCKANYVWIFVARLISVGLFCVLKNLDLNRGATDAILAKYTTVRKFSDNAAELGEECAICFGEYVNEEPIRTLQCKHSFHRDCIDAWVQKRKNRCPLCSSMVGPDREKAD